MSRDKGYRHASHSGDGNLYLEEYYRQGKIYFDYVNIMNNDVNICVNEIDKLERNYILPESMNF